MKLSAWVEVFISISNVVVTAILFFTVLLRSHQKRLSTLKSADQGRGQELKYEKQPAHQWVQAASDAKATQQSDELAKKALEESEADVAHLIFNGLTLPFDAMKVVALRSDTYTRDQAYGGAPLVPATLILLSVVILVFYHFPLYSIWVSWFIIFALTLLGVMLLRTAQFASRDMECQEIDGFLEHRDVRFTTKNSLSLLTLVASVFQLGGVAATLFRRPVAGAPTSVDRVKAVLKNFCDYFLIDFQSLSHYVSNIENLKIYFKYAQIAGMMLAVVVFWALFGGLLHRVFTLAAPAGVAVEELGSAEDTIKTMMGRAKGRKQARLNVYETVKTASMYTTLFFLLSDTLVVTIVNALLQVLSCHSDTSGTLLLDIDGVTQCFVGGHAWLSVLAVAMLIWYIVTVIIAAPFVMADSDGIFSSPELDLRYVPSFYAKERLAKCALTFATVMFKQYAVIPRNLNFLVNMWLAYIATTNRPCSVMWVNVARVTVYLASSLISLFVIVDAIFDGASWICFALPPLLILLAVHFVVGIQSAWDTPQFSMSAPVGLTQGKNNSTSFTDTSMMRGSVHKIVAIRFWEHMWNGGEGINGIALTYEIDGTVLQAPAHQSTWFRFGDSSTEITLENDEHIIAMHDGGLRPMLCYGFATSKGKRYKVGDPRGDLPDDLNSWKLQAKAGEVVGFAGHTNGRVQNLYFILQEKHEKAADALAEPLLA